MSFDVFGSDIAVCTTHNLIIFNIITNEECIIPLPTLPRTEHPKQIPPHVSDELDIHINVSFSNDGEYLVTCTDRKQLCLFHRKSKSLKSQWILQRAAIKVKFTPKNDIVVADKSGDAYLFSTTNPCPKGTLLLGHLSMLLDILVTNNNRFIITADRDEKIRISMYPNSDEIVSYCLGHTQFVSSIVELPNNILISAGGDGDLRVWNYLKGEEISQTSFRDKFEKDELTRLNSLVPEFDKDGLDLPVQQLVVMNADTSFYIIIASFYCSNKFLVYKMAREVIKHEIDFLQVLDIGKEPLEVCVQENRFWILTDSNIKMLEWNGCEFVVNKDMDDKLKPVNDLWQKVWGYDDSPALLQCLYKRKYDNVQEYQKRKKNRLNKILDS